MSRAARPAFLVLWSLFFLLLVYLYLKYSERRLDPSRVGPGACGRHNGMFGCSTYSGGRVEVVTVGDGVLTIVTFSDGGVLSADSNLVTVTIGQEDAPPKTFQIRQLTCSLSYAVSVSTTLSIAGRNSTSVVGDGPYGVCVFICPDETTAKSVLGAMARASGSEVVFRFYSD
ncbi:ORF022 [Saltwater crocodilepox virus]|nr:ORF022 [Saltwater crocodilepox virus]QGT49032.1 ORF022 [Saltwater crocodilepox virus]